MKLVKIIAVTAIATTLTVQAAQAGSLLGNNDSTGSSLFRTYEDKDIYDSSGSQMTCWIDSWGNTICE